MKTMDLFNLARKTAIVTGGATGLGQRRGLGEKTISRVLLFFLHRKPRTTSLGTFYVWTEA
jgi:hypothetical protein